MMSKSTKMNKSAMLIMRNSSSQSYLMRTRRGIIRTKVYNTSRVWLFWRPTLLRAAIEAENVSTPNFPEKWSSLLFSRKKNFFPPLFLTFWFWFAQNHAVEKITFLFKRFYFFKNLSLDFTIYLKWKSLK